jgi:uncharacterized protein YkwD
MRFYVTIRPYRSCVRSPIDPRSDVKREPGRASAGQSPSETTGSGNILKGTLISALALFCALVVPIEVQAGEASLDKEKRLRARFVVQVRLEEYLMAEINRVRTTKGLNPLKPNLKLQEVARRHSLDMSSLNYFSHEDLNGHSIKDRLSSARLGWKRLGENIAKCRSSDPAKTALAGWLESPGHRSNILNKGFTETGIGAVADLEGEVSFCQIFMTR